MAVGNEKAPKEIICPGCGGVIKNTAFNPITDTCGAMLQDGWLCPESPTGCGLSTRCTIPTTSPPL